MSFSKGIEYVLLSYALFKLLSSVHETVQLMLGKWIKLGKSFLSLWNSTSILYNFTIWFTIFQLLLLCKRKT